MTRKEVQPSVSQPEVVRRIPTGILSLGKTVSSNQFDSLQQLHQHEQIKEITLFDKTVVAGVIAFLLLTSTAEVPDIEATVGEKVPDTVQIAGAEVELGEPNVGGITALELVGSIVGIPLAHTIQRERQKDAYLDLEVAVAKRTGEIIPPEKQIEIFRRRNKL